MFVYLTVIHHNHRVRSRIWLHSVKQTVNKFQEGLCAKRTLHDVTIQNAITKWEGWKNRETIWKISSDGITSKKGGLPPSVHKKCLALCFCASDRPCTTSVCRLAIHRTFIDKYKLLGSILPYQCKVVQAFVCRPFQRNTGYLKDRSKSKSIITNESYLFQCIPSFLKGSPNSSMRNGDATRRCHHFL